MSGISLRRGQLVAVVTETPAEASLLADRLGRFVPDVAGVTINGTPLGLFSVRDTRRNIVVSEIEPRLFSGELRYELVPHGDISDGHIMPALEATSSLDILDALEEGLDTLVEERGRSFSGGQRQRLSLVRAILTNAEVLILVEPTSAVDTHTEGRIAQRLRAVRGAHTTLVATTSPLLLEKMDLVYVVVDGRAVEHGTHDELLATSPPVSPDRVARGQLMSQLPVADTATVHNYARRLITPTPRHVGADALALRTGRVHDAHPGLHHRRDHQLRGRSPVDGASHHALRRDPRRLVDPRRGTLLLRPTP